MSDDKQTEINETKEAPKAEPQAESQSEINRLKAEVASLTAQRKSAADDRIAAQQQLNEFKSKFDGIDDDALTQMKAAYDAKVANETVSRADHERLLKEARDEAAAPIAAERDKYRSQYEDREIKAKVMGAVLGVGVPQESALDDISTRIGAAFGMNDAGELVSKADPTVKVDPKEWSQNLREGAAHLFKPNTGGGSTGSGTSDAAGKIKVKRNDVLAKKQHYRALQSGDAVLVD